MIVDQSLLLGQFAKRRNVPVKYDRNLVAATMKAMERIEEIRAKRERVFVRRRLRGKVQRDRRRIEDAKEVVKGEHLIQKELNDLQQARQEVELVANEVVQTQTVAPQVLGQERMRQKRRMKRKMLVGGGTEEEMDVD